METYYKLHFRYAILLAALAGLATSCSNNKDSELRAVAELERLDQKKDAASSAFEPQYFEAEKAVSAVKSRNKTKLRNCLFLLQVYRDSRDSVIRSTPGGPTMMPVDAPVLISPREQVSQCLVELKR